MLVSAQLLLCLNQHHRVYLSFPSQESYFLPPILSFIKQRDKFASMTVNSTHGFQCYKYNIFKEFIQLGTLSSRDSRDSIRRKNILAQGNINRTLWPKNSKSCVKWWSPNLNSCRCHCIQDGVCCITVWFEPNPFRLNVYGTFRPKRKDWWIQYLMRRL